MTPEDAGAPTWPDEKQAAELGYPGVGPDDVPIFDSELDVPSSTEKPVHGVRMRHLEIARLHALGKTNNEICDLLGFTASRISILLREPFIQAEVARIRHQMFDQDVADKLKEASQDGARLIHEVILDPKEKMTTRVDAAKWVNEKTYGKASQQITVESATLLQFMEAQKQLLAQGETIDVTPALPEARRAEGVESAGATAQRDKWDAWLDEHLPTPQP